ncbi:MAG: hypothetical protein IT431_08105 [Phycisphaerales bacterium]|nr:hypothetical protein [Phycisphaerales bacterium]
MQNGRIVRAVVWLVSVAVGALALAGCAVPGEPYRPAQLGAGESVVYVYRPRSVLSPGPVEVFVDQTPVGRLTRNTYLAVVVAPGEHLVRVQRRSDATRLVLVGEGQGAILEAGASLLGGFVSLVDPGEEVGRERIAGTRGVEVRGEGGG